MISSEEVYFERVKQYCSEDVESCRYCEDYEAISGYRKIKGNKEVTWTKGHLPYIGPDYGVFPRVVFLGYDDPRPNGYSMDWLRDYLGHDRNLKENQRAGQVQFVRDLSGRSFPTISTLNAHLCSCVKKKTSKSMMQLLKQPCVHSWHILLDILAPDLLIVEGRRQWESSKKYLQGKGLWKASAMEVSSGRGHLCTLEYDKRDILVLFVYHPSRFWDSPKKPYYKEVVLPLIEACKKNMKL